MNLSAIELVIRVSRATVGASEVPPASNAGPYVERVQKLTGIPKGSPWCAAQVRNVGYSALGPLWPIPAIGGCQYLHDWAKAKGVVYESPQVGDIFVVWHPELKRFGHTGLVVDQVTVDGWLCSEGNTSGGGSREGWLVAERRRFFHPEDRFIRWIELLKKGDR